MTTDNIQQIETKGIRVDMGTQTRETIDDEVVQEYAAAMEAGAEFPPIVVFYVEAQGEYVLADGYHRLEAHRRVRANQPINAEVLEGNLYDALWYSYSANKDHGLHRSRQDKSRATRAALLHIYGAEMSNVQIAKHVGVTDKTVARVRRELESTSEIPRLENRQGADGKMRPVSPLIKKPSSDEQAYEPQRVCNECDFYDDMGGYCPKKKQLQRPWENVCDEYKPKRSHAVKPKHRPVIPNRRLKGMVEVYLPPDNPQLAAVELREYFPLDYLRSVFHALEVIEGGDCAA